MGAFIKAGKIERELGKVTNAITVLRHAYQRTFGFDDEASHRPRLPTILDLREMLEENGQA